MQGFFVWGKVGPPSRGGKRWRENEVWDDQNNDHEEQRGEKG